MQIGKYEMRCIKWQWGETLKGDVCIDLLLEVVAENPEQRELIQCRRYTGTKPDRTGRTRNSRTLAELQALGFSGDSFTRALIGLGDKTARVTVALNDKGFPDVKWIDKASGEFRLPPASPSVLAAFLGTPGTAPEPTPKTVASKEFPFDEDYPL